MSKTKTDLEQYPAQYRPALSLLIPLWRGLGSAYKQQYARNIWEQFEANIQSAAYTSSLSKFYNSICSKLAIQVTVDTLPDVVAAITRDDEQRLLEQLRNETATLVLMVRLENEARKEQWREREAVRQAVEAEATQDDEPSIGGLFDD